MRLLSYNIHKGIGGRDRRYRLDRVIEVIESEQPDLICLQEVDFQVRRTGYQNQPALLAEHFKVEAHFYQRNVPIGEGGYGNLILSRWPFHQRHPICLRMGKRKPRGAQLVVVDTPEGHLRLVNWHLGLAEKERRWQVRLLLAHELFQDLAHLPTLIAGDYNDWRNSLGRHAFDIHSFMQATAPASLFRSFPAFLTLISLDKLFYRGELEIQETRIVRTSLARQASDHLPLVVDFQLSESQRISDTPSQNGDGSDEG